MSDNEQTHKEDNNLNATLKLLLEHLKTTSNLSAAAADATQEHLKTLLDKLDQIPMQDIKDKLPGIEEYTKKITEYLESRQEINDLMNKVIAKLAASKTVDTVDDIPHILSVAIQFPCPHTYAHSLRLSKNHSTTR